MKGIANNLTDLIGNTPLLQLNNLMKYHQLKANLIAKLESFNPLSSVKDRAAYSMIIEAEKAGVINKNTTLIEATSGNTGIALSYISAAKKYKLVLVMPDTMSVERRNLITAFGAQLILTPGSEGMKGAINKAKELHEVNSNSFIVSQFDNPANPKIHYETTGREIWEDTEGSIDILVAGVGTGGTISGAGTYLKEKNPNILIIAVEPEASAVMTGNPSGPHKIQGIGAGFIPQNMNMKLVDQILQVSNESAFKTCKELAEIEGLLVGISSGAAVAAAQQIASEVQYKEKNIVVILPDTGERYLSMDLFA